MRILEKCHVLESLKCTGTAFSVPVVAILWTNWDCNSTLPLYSHKQSFRGYIGVTSRLVDRLGSLWFKICWATCFLWSLVHRTSIKYSPVWHVFRATPFSELRAHGPVCACGRVIYLVITVVVLSFFSAFLLCVLAVNIVSHELFKSFYMCMYIVATTRLLLTINIYRWLYSLKCNVKFCWFSLLIEPFWLNVGRLKYEIKTKYYVCVVILTWANTFSHYYDN